MKTSFKIEGLRELEGTLAELPKATGKNVLRRTLRAVAKLLRDAAEANAPELTGKLSDDVRIGTKLTRRQRKAARRSKSTVELYVGVSDPAGVQTEFGNEHQAATPWFRPAWDATKHKMLRMIASILGAELSKAARRLAKKTAHLARR